MKGSHQVRVVDEGLWVRLHHLALEQGRRVGEVVHEALTVYIGKAVKADRAVGDPKPGRRKRVGGVAERQSASLLRSGPSETGEDVRLVPPPPVVRDEVFPSDPIVPDHGAVKTDGTEYHPLAPAIDKPDPDLGF